MATFKDPEVGDVIYVHAQKPGKIIAIFSNSHGDQCIAIQWIDGTRDVITAKRVKDFNALIKDHEKKLRTHLGNLLKVLKMEVK